jgi:hypothetical protein
MNERKLVVYVAGPYTAETREEILANLEIAEKAARDLFALGFIPIIPHKLSAFWDEDPRFTSFGHTQWLTDFCYPIQDICDMVFLCPGWKNSKGACLEHEHAHETRQPHAETVEHLCSLGILIFEVEKLKEKMRGKNETTE